MPRKTGSKAKSVSKRSTTRDLNPRKTTAVKGGSQPTLRGGVFVAAGDVNGDGTTTITSR